MLQTAKRASFVHCWYSVSIVDCRFFDNC